ncbi:MAG: Rrf2 family protein [Flavobacteriales bacterium]
MKIIETTTQISAAKSISLVLPMLSKKTKYGIKAITFIAKQERNVPVPIASIVESENISHKYLESILLTLRKSGFLGSKKGRYGGYYLLKDPKDVSMSEVMRALEGPIALIPCVSLNYYERCEDCVDEKACSVNRLMAEVRDSMLNVFNNCSLADLISQ